MNKICSVILVGLFFTSLALSGCDSASYSRNVVYTLRSDPLVLKENELGKERPTPDRPGQLPILSAKDLLDPLNPLHPQPTEKGEKGKDPIEAGVVRDPKMIGKEDRATINAYLREMFGTPAEPRVPGFDEPDKKDHFLMLDAAALAKGSSLYRIHCLHCHGVTGDGRGPTARWVNPHPRDYRQGRFKFASVDQTQRPSPPTRDDLLRVLRLGLEGTAMPSFVLLPNEELEALVSYVIHLSLRGSTEFDTVKNGFDYDPGEGTLTANQDLGTLIEEVFAFNLEKWEKAPTIPINVPPYPYLDDPDLSKLKASVANGQKLFLAIGEEGKKANCVQCHIDYGRRSLFRYDMWGTLSKPNNFTQGVFRGGRRPVDMYHRIHSGILPSGMAAFGDTLKTKNGAGQEDGRLIWDLVNFVQVLGNPAMRKSLGIVID